MLLAGAREGEVLNEPPRRIAVSNGKLKDWIAPLGVHAYRFRL